MATQFQQRCDAYDVYREHGVSLFRSLWYDHLALSISIAALFRICRDSLLLRAVRQDKGLELEVTDPQKEQG